jgi:hypothetical protein
MGTEEIIETLRKKFERVSEVLDERGRRVWAAAEAEALGYGGQSIVAKATGLARITLYREGLRQVSDQGPYPEERIRNLGGWSQEADRAGADVVVGIGSFSGAHYPRRSGKSAKMDLLEYPSVGRSSSKARVSDRPSDSGRTIGGVGLQPARESENEGRFQSPG